MPFLRALILTNGLAGETYVEPFAGGAGAAWALLLEGTVSNVVLNDLDPAIFAFWRALFRHTDDLCELISRTPISMRTWKRQTRIIEEPGGYSIVALAYATFFLNRTNRSGVIRGGVIGGKDQSGEWKLGARFNTDDLIERIRRIAELRNRVAIYGMEAVEFIRKVGPKLPRPALVFMDPPYLNRGKDLYLHTYTSANHSELASAVRSTIRRRWVVSYDSGAFARRLYKGYPCRLYYLSYSAAERYVGAESLFLSKDLSIPRRHLPRRTIPRTAASRTRGKIPPK